MKTMTCRQLGGPCDAEHRGNDHNEVIQAQDRHLKEQVAAGDESHRDAAKAMRGRWKRPSAASGGTETSSASSTACPTTRRPGTALWTARP
jgi:predicted small metal-binding protein